jgi:hypothetical protein
MSFKKPDDSRRGKLIYSSLVETKMKTGDGVEIVEKRITHEDDMFQCKFYEKKSGKAERIIVKAPVDGKSYTLIVTKDNGEAKTSTHDKKEILEYLEKNEKLKFMVEYIKKTKTLARAHGVRKVKKSKSKSGSKAKSKSKSKSKPKSKKASKGSKK